MFQPRGDNSYRINDSLINYKELFLWRRCTV